MTVKKLLYDLYQEIDTSNDDHLKNTLTSKLNWYVKLPYESTVQLNSCLSIYNTLNKHIYGMQQVKEKLLLYINKNNKNNILTLKGAPGVGKTKLVQILAQAVGLPFGKISLGGAIDSSVLLGSNGIWIGSEPSIILQILAQTKCSKTIILLDEIDKLTASIHGTEVQHALLQILDKTQNKEFNDNFLNLFPHDLSNVWVIATMNYDDNMSKPLKDRLEIIEVPSYSKDDMVKIIINHTLPEACIECGLQMTDLNISEGACRLILDRLNKQEGMRNIEKEVGTIVSKIHFINKNKDMDNYNMSFKLNNFTGYPYMISERTVKELMTTPTSSTKLYEHMYS
jgi:ATP-dependent Lon protease